MQNGYEIRDQKWSSDRRRRSPSAGYSLVPQHAYGWTPTAPNGGWRDASKTPADIFEVNASTVKFVSLCALWYLSSALSSNTGKAIMLIFKYPVTLTIVQFGFIATYCLLLGSPWVRLTKLRKPTAPILKNTLPMAAFQVGGHISSSMAISRIPVSTVHTIKVSYATLHTVRALIQPKSCVGFIPAIHRRCLCNAVRCQILRHNLRLPPPIDRRRHARLHLRHVGFQFLRYPLRVQLSHHLCLFKYFFQENNAQSDRRISSYHPQTR